MIKLDSDKASTAFIGNWGIIDAIAKLSDMNGFGTLISARLFMGKKRSIKSKIDIPLSVKDSKEIIDNQWASLRY